MIAQFALRLICGMSLTWCVMPRAQVTAGFFRIQMLVVLGLSVLAGLTCPQIEAVVEGQSWLGLSATRAVCVLLAVSAFAGSIMWTLARRAAGGLIAYMVAALAVAGVVGTAALAGDSRPGGLHAFGQALTIASDLSSAWLVGGATAAMLLGHSYLTAPMMSLAPLERLTRLLGAAALLRGLLAGLSLLWLGEWSFSQTQWTWLALRWTAGVIGPLIVCALVWRILRYRNTQSATGVLFAGVIVAYIGETAAMLLQRDVGVPL